MLTKEEINAIIDHKIMQHEIKMAIISGIAGMVFLPIVTYSIVCLYLRWL